VIRRKRKISFRLTREEDDRYSPMVAVGWANSWSNVCRMALKEMWERKQKADSDNIKVDEEAEMSDTRSDVGQKKKPAKVKSSRPRKKLAK
jgi:hypothetical protein